jgi:Aminotransferase class-V
VEEIVGRARALGLVTVVDGAHAPGQVPVDLANLGADFYSANAQNEGEILRGAAEIVGKGRPGGVEETGQTAIEEVDRLAL